MKIEIPFSTPYGNLEVYLWSHAPYLTSVLMGITVVNGIDYTVRVDLLYLNEERWVVTELTFVRTKEMPNVPSWHNQVLGNTAVENFWLRYKFVSDIERLFSAFVMPAMREQAFEEDLQITQSSYCGV